MHGNRAPSVDAINSMPMDLRYRDLCLQGSKLKVTKFNTKTGEVIGLDADSMADSAADSLADSPANVFGAKFQGTVVGVKPTGAACIPMKDTDKVTLSDSLADPALAFAYYLNVDDEDTYLKSRIENQDKNNYNQSNYLKENAFFIGGNVGCPNLKYSSCADSIADSCAFSDSPAHATAPARHDLIKQMQARRRYAANCYDLYIKKHDIDIMGTHDVSTTLERPGVSADDPLSQYDPIRSILNDCQPLVDGNSALLLEFGRNSQKPNESKAGYAKVLMYPYRPDLDEADYLLSDYMQKQKTFPKVVFKRKVGLPCVRDQNDTRVPNYPVPLPAICVDGATCPPPPPPPCGPYSIPIPQGTDYVSPQKSNNVNYYCPNIEKITEPSHPFSPRNDTGTSSTGTSSSGNGFSATVSSMGMWSQTGALTDRDYSQLTSQKLQDPNDVGKCYTPDLQWMYTDYSKPGNGDCGLVRDCEDRELNPTVQCAIVPVDILSFRQAAFDTCIRQRIYYNIDIFLLLWWSAGWDDISPYIQATDNDQNMPGYVDFYTNFNPPYPPFWGAHPQTYSVYGQSPIFRPGKNPSYPGTWPLLNGRFNPPCKTRFFESDDADHCPVNMSIQQCCHIITKDVVPANFLKIRTCEGLRQDRIDNIGITLSMTPPDSPPDSGGACNSSPGDCYDNDFDMDDFDSPATSNSDSMGACPTPQPPPHSPAIVNIYDEEFLWDYNPVQHEKIMDGDSYKVALLFTEVLNQVGCHDTEPDEYQFKHWFESWSDPYTGLLIGYHMPYMRWYDTGVSAGQQFHGGSFVNTLGGFDTLVGVGREERSKEDSYQAKLQSYIFGSPMTDGLVQAIGTQEQSQAGRMGGWLELKAHEMWSIRRSNLFCVGRYEKLFKEGGPEDFALRRAGGNYLNTLGNEYPWPLGWRGYASDSHGEGFPTVGGGGASATGLDNAEIGDIIVYKLNGVNHVAYVANVFKPAGVVRSVSILTWDQGKYPDATGASVSWGFGPQRQIYKYAVTQDDVGGTNPMCRKTLRALTNAVGGDPANPNTIVGNCKGREKDDAMIAAACQSNNCQPSCADPDYIHCVMPNGMADWNAVKIYHPRDNVRACSSTCVINQPCPDPISSISGASTGIASSNNTPFIDTNYFSWMVNFGFDPPLALRSEEGYKGVGAYDKTNLCGYAWTTINAQGQVVTKEPGCRGSAAPQNYKFFPVGPSR